MADAPRTRPDPAPGAAAFFWAVGAAALLCAASLPGTDGARAPLGPPPRGLAPRAWPGRTAVFAVRGGAVRGAAGRDDGSGDEAETEDETEGPAGREEEEDEEEETEEEEEEETEEETRRAAPGPPVSVRLRAAPVLSSSQDSPLVSHSTTANYSRTRTVLSIRQTVSRTWPGRPPLATVVVRLGPGGRVLPDDATVGGLLPDDWDEEEDEEEEDEGEDALPALTLVLDCVPPVDPKFAVEYAGGGGDGLGQWLADASTRELYDAYVTNEAALAERGRELCAAADGAEDGAEDAPDRSATASMWRYAAALDAAVRGGLPPGVARRHGLADGEDGGEEEEEKKEAAEAVRQARIRQRTVVPAGSAVAAAGGGGATTGVRRVLQKNLNINWLETLRNAALFLFFGLFGGRTARTKAAMFAGAPLCFLLQARPTKVLLKRLYYAIGAPPGIVLSLLPAPHQVIMGLDAEEAMEFLYGSRNVGGGAPSPSGDDDDDEKEGGYGEDDEGEESEAEETDSDEDEDSEYD